MKQAYLTEFDRLEATLPGLRELRRKAIERFAELGLPTGREEGWRFTDVTPVVETSFQPVILEPELEGIEELASGPLSNSQLTFIDGRYAPQFSNPPREAASLAELLAKNPGAIEPRLAKLAGVNGHPFAALNTAFVRDGAYIHVPRGQNVDVHVLFLSTTREGPFVTYPRILLVAEEGSSVEIVESYVGGTGVHLTNSVVEAYVGENASVDLTKLQREGAEAYHFATIQVHQSRASRFVSHSVSLGAALSRNDLGVILDGEGAECVLDGLYELTSRQVSDHHTTIDHAKPHCTSRELYKGILDGKSRGVFDGRIIVRPDAQKTNAVQANKNLLLSDGAIVNTKPQLEIFANDVKCKHGATIGKLDADVLFYLRSRGIGRDEARRLLIHAFACEVLDPIRVPEVRDLLEEYLLDLVSRKGV